jgi:hypothetical protein
MGKKVVVFGCGPAGLMAAHAAVLSGTADDVRIVSRKRKSPMLGAQYLHLPIPGVTRYRSGFDIDYQLRGSVAGYREKIYNPMVGRDISVSVESLVGKRRAWSIRDAYDKLWELYEDYIIEIPDIRTNHIQDVLDWNADHYISTLPATLLCEKAGWHRFVSQDVWVSDNMIEQVPANTVVCNGEYHTAWYRVSNIDGHANSEWPSEDRPPIKVAQVKKPIGTDCGCFPDIVQMGRYGKWKKGILAHEAFYETLDLVGRT